MREIEQMILDGINERKSTLQREIAELKVKINNMEKYKALGSNLFGFEIFEEVFRVINERGEQSNESMFKAGVASAEAAVRRLREEYYEAIIKQTTEEG